MKQTIGKIWYLLTSLEKRQAVFLLLMILIMALLDTIGVASILPFMAVLANPEIIETNAILNAMFQRSKIFGIENNQHFLFVLGIIVLLLLIISLIFKAITTYVQVQFTQMRQYSIGKRVIEGYLHQPYSWFLNRHSAELGKTILSEIGVVVGNGIKPLIELVAKGMVATALIILLIITDPKLALIIGFSLGGAYALIYKYVYKYIGQIGKKRLHSNKLRFITVNEAFGAAKEVKVGGIEQTYIDRFSYAAKEVARNSAYASFLGQVPRFALEAIAFGGIMLIILYLMTQTGSFNNALPIISLYVFAGYRLLPALQQIYVSFTQLTFVQSSVDKLHDDIKKLKPINRAQEQEILSFNETISLKNIYFEYPKSSKTALKNISINIDAKTIVGLVGPTGSGKTTTVDIILGLLEAQKGTLEVDGKVISEQNSRNWQRSIGYVPQQIFLSDDTVAANIAFGLEPKNINLEHVEKASKIANLHEFVSNELPKKYQTTIGERGVRLSGGQRQRIGIARALYHNPQLLIFDEATSALDNLTEKAVMDAVNNLSKKITIIIIAHRLSTVKKCDKIFFLEKGEIKNTGSFEDLIKTNENFKIATSIN